MTNVSSKAAGSQGRYESGIGLPVAPPGALRRDGRRSFSFAVIADSHLEPEAHGVVLPRSNWRNRRLVSALAPLQPAFVLHLGDIVHPVPQAPGHLQTMSLAQSLYAELGRPVLWTPGNHDVGDKANEAMPAATVTDDWLGEYGRQFGDPWLVHDTGACVVLMLNSPILNAGSSVEREQRLWFERALREAKGRRIFVATHYPPYLVSPDEVGHYDNIDPPARGWLLDLLHRHRVEALFCGHVHNLFYHRLGATEIYLLPSPSFVRRDYSEMYPLAPSLAEEFGRNDVAKLGCFWVDVYEQGHVARLIRSSIDIGDGDNAMKDAAGSALAAPLLIPGHPKDPGQTPFGLTLRHPWAELTTLPHNPPVDEFSRRDVRNDYPVQALWDLGIRAVRAPIADLVDPQVRGRVADLVALGQRFTFFSAGLPNQDLLALLRREAPLVSRWECVVPMRDLAALAEAVAPLVAEAGLEVMWSDLRSAAIGNAGKHFTAPGCLPSEVSAVAAMLRRLPPRIISAVGFRLSRDALDDKDIMALETFSQSNRIKAVVTWALMPEGPNDQAMDDGDVLARVERLFATATRFASIDFILDGFTDIDRGYYPRAGLVDRRGNLRPAGEWLRQRRAAGGN